MGQTKQKYYDILETVSELLKSGYKIKHLDKLLRYKLSPEDYKFYIEYKENILMDVFNIEEGCGCGPRRPRPIFRPRPRPGAPKPKRLHEKFREVSDPIRDMGIGLFKKQYFKQPYIAASFIVKNISLILETDGIPNDIIFGENSSWYTYNKEYLPKIREYIYKYVFSFDKRQDSSFLSTVFRNIITILREMGYPKKMNENKKYIMKNKLFENYSDLDIQGVCMIGLMNISRWISHEDYSTLISELQRLQRSRTATIEDAIAFVYDFFEAHIHKLFNVIIKYSDVTLEILEDNSDAIIDRMTRMVMGREPIPVDKKYILPREGDEEREEEEDETEKIIKQSQEKKKAEESKPKDYSKMSQYDLQRAADEAIDKEDYETLKKISQYVKEGTFLKYHIENALNEEFIIKPLFEENTEHKHITRSYQHPMTRDEVKAKIEKILTKHRKTAMPIKNMKHWLDLNNLGNYQHDKWLRAIVDVLFTNAGHTWSRKNTQYSVEQLTDKVMDYWHNKLSK